MEPWLCFFDVDGTLEFRDHDPITAPEDIAALKRLKEEGHYLVLNTGRSRAVVPQRLLDVIPFDGLICGSSYVEWRGEVLHRAPIDGETLRAVGRYVLARGIRAIFECEHMVYTLNGGVYHKGLDITDCFEETVKNAEAMRVTKMTFEEEIPEADAKAFPKIRIINFGDYCEGIRRGYDKAFGMKLLCEKLGVPQAHTAAFGDSENDVEMLKYAKKGVIMAHAPAFLDSVAAYRAKSEVGGVAEGVFAVFLV